MLENNPPHDGAPGEDAEEDDFDLFSFVAEEDEDEDGEELGEQENVLARVERMADPEYSSIELEKIPPRFWKQTLAPLHRQQRMWLARRVPDSELRDLAIE